MVTLRERLEEEWVVAAQEKKRELDTAVNLLGFRWISQDFDQLYPLKMTLT